MLELVLLEEQVLGFDPARRSTVVNELGMSLLTVNGDATKLGTQPQRGVQEVGGKCLRKIWSGPFRHLYRPGE
jgi:hypothetical protein